MNGQKSTSYPQTYIRIITTAVILLSVEVPTTLRAEMKSSFQQVHLGTESRKKARKAIIILVTNEQ